MLVANIRTKFLRSAGTLLQIFASCLPTLLLKHVPILYLLSMLSIRDRISLMTIICTFRKTRPSYELELSLLPASVLALLMFVVLLCTNVYELANRNFGSLHLKCRYYY